MFVPDEVRKSVVFLGYQKPDGNYKLMGTGFFLTHIIGATQPAFLPARGRGFSYLVTAKHVIDGIRDNYAVKVSVRANHRDGLARWIETNIDEWLFHPTEFDSVDVAVLRVTIANDLDHIGSPIQSVATEEIISEAGIGIGDEVFMAGLFAPHYGGRKNIPIIRVGNISAMPEEPVEVRQLGLMDAYLIEARSLGGLSGSPVFVHIPANRVNRIAMNQDIQFTGGGTVFFLLGLMHGHWDTTSDPDTINEDLRETRQVNMGIAIVVPATKIMEVIGQPTIKKKEQEIMREEHEKAQAKP